MWNNNRIVTKILSQSMFCVVCIDRIRFIASSGAQSILAFNHFFRTDKNRKRQQRMKMRKKKIWIFKKQNNFILFSIFEDFFYSFAIVRPIVCWCMRCAKNVLHINKEEVKEKKRIEKEKQTFERILENGFEFKSRVILNYFISVLHWTVNSAVSKLKLILNFYW